ncbi:sensor histidine kinase [Aggregatilinea lenta]|uniref:sensor histidine kinase n=1 Tax=Aggregatilinea lenta TaxID=913108 RepID=UPI000E5BA276|nr:HAMP domain-containing sensor histidine kinase [Aggregatilinea lenta]
MRLHSIRWRLTFSYAAIACLAALALGTVLLSTMRGYYAGKERAYLTANAESFEALLTTASAENVPISALQPQLKNLAFFANVRVRVIDGQGFALVDTGNPDDPYVISFVYAASDHVMDNLRFETISLAPVTATGASNAQGGGAVASASGDLWQVSIPPDATVYPSTGYVPLLQSQLGTQVGQAPAGANETIQAPAAKSEGTINVVSTLPLSSTFYGFALGDGVSSRKDIDVMRRSSQEVESTIVGANQGRVATLVLSDGPAYGSDIVQSTARGWLLASSIAILLAAAAGWIVSYQISKPLLALTEATTNMMAGDLSTRANIARRDELGVLALSFNAMADQIQEIVVTLQRFVADAAHELHTPLTALRTSLEVAQREAPSAAMQRAHEQVIRLERLTDGLLELSRVEARSGGEPPTPVDLGLLIRSTSELYASRAEQANLNYALSLPDDSPRVLGFAGQLGGVIANLMDNAIKFTPAGGSVSLTLRTVDQYVEMIVLDTGIGIPADDLPQLFERFRRGHNAVHYPGSGLGLAIAKAIVRAHGGTIAAESGDGGTTITVRLPQAPAPP